ncbi:MAG: T9SS type A sorting domain-containing protein [Bacteroidia bacterium]|nr:T9SS type A sorting domain-containing protein [Bacteroidia bacterium]
MRSILLLIYFTSCLSSFAQKQDRIWIFGDHGGIDFDDTSNVNSFYSVFNGSQIKSTCGSISNNNGSLLFYAAADQFLTLGVDVFNRNGPIMLNGDKLQGHPAQTQGLVIMPYPSDTSKYYIFHKNQTSSKNFLYYSTVDMTLDGGLGGITNKNTVVPCDSLTQRTTAVKHANGRDWWLVQQRWDQPEYITFLITPDGIQGPYKYQVINPSPKLEIFGTSRFSRSGNKLVSVGTHGSVDLMDFNRCTGTISNFERIGENIFSNENSYLGCEFSPNENVLYVANSYPSPGKFVYQFDLTAPDIKASKQTLNMYPDTGLLQYVQYSHMLLGPDNKIYISKGNGSGINSNTIYTQSIDVILDPDVIGPGCNYRSNYLYLNGGRTTYGLPNMVNYNLGPVTGSICDSLNTGISENKEKSNPFIISPNPVKHWINIYQRENFTNGKPIHATLFNLQGKIVLEKEMNAYDYSIPVSDLSIGVYVLQLKTMKSVFSERVMKVE